jgi:hypothetical protein
MMTVEHDGSLASLKMLERPCTSHTSVVVCLPRFKLLRLRACSDGERRVVTEALEGMALLEQPPIRGRCSVDRSFGVVPSGKCRPPARGPAILLMRTHRREQFTAVPANAQNAF